MINAQLSDQKKFRCFFDSYVKTFAYLKQFSGNKLDKKKLLKQQKQHNHIEIFRFSIPINKAQAINGQTLNFFTIRQNQKRFEIFTQKIDFSPKRRCDGVYLSVPF